MNRIILGLEADGLGTDDEIGWSTRPRTRTLLLRRILSAHDRSISQHMRRWCQMPITLTLTRTLLRTWFPTAFGNLPPAQKASATPCGPPGGR